MPLTNGIFYLPKLYSCLNYLKESFTCGVVCVIVLCIYFEILFLMLRSEFGGREDGEDREELAGLLEEVDGIV